MVVSVCAACCGDAEYLAWTEKRQGLECTNALVLDSPWIHLFAYAPSKPLGLGTCCHDLMSTFQMCPYIRGHAQHTNHNRSASYGLTSASYSHHSGSGLTSYSGNHNHASSASSFVRAHRYCVGSTAASPALGTSRWTDMPFRIANKPPRKRLSQRFVVVCSTRARTLAMSIIRINRLINQYLNKSVRRLLTVGAIALFLGNYSASLVITIIGDAQDYDAAAGFIVTLWVEIMSRWYYASSKPTSLQKVLNAFKVGLIYGFVFDALRLCVRY